MSFHCFIPTVSLFSLGRVGVSHQTAQRKNICICKLNFWTTDGLSRLGFRSRSKRLSRRLKYGLKCLCNIRKVTGSSKTFETSANHCVFLIDALALIYRAHFALARSGLRTSYGLDTGPIYGFISTLVSLLETHRPLCVVLVFDSYFPQDTSSQSNPWQRRLIYPDYKRNRSKMPTAIETSLPYIKALVSALGISIIEVASTEADDVIGSLVKHCISNSFAAKIVSVDKDFLQLLQDSTCSILRPRTTTKSSINAPTSYTNTANLSSWSLITESEFRQTYDNLSPSQYCDVLALMGDTADNIPGVGGIGEKQAVSLVKRFGSIESLVENWKNISSPRLREKIFLHRELLLLSKTLVTIHQDVKIPSFESSDFFIRPPQLEKLNYIMEKLEFKKLRERVDKYIKTSSIAADSLHWKHSWSDSKVEKDLSEGIAKGSERDPLELVRMKKFEKLGFRYFCLSTLGSCDIAEEKWEHLLSLIRKQSDEIPFIAFWTDYDIDTGDKKNLKTYSFDSLSLPPFIGNMWKKLLNGYFSFQDIFSINGIIISWNSSSCIYIDLKNAKDAWIQQLEWLLCHSKISKVSIFVKKQIHILQRYSNHHLSLSLPLIDILVGHNATTPFESLSVEQVMKRYALLGGDTDMLDILEFMFSNMKDESFHEIHSDASKCLSRLLNEMEKNPCISLADWRIWCQCNWTMLLFRAARFLNSELNNLSMKTFVEYVEYPLIPVLATMERNGIYLDTRKLAVITSYKLNKGLQICNNKQEETTEPFHNDLLGNAIDKNNEISGDQVIGNLSECRELCTRKRKHIKTLQRQTNPISGRFHVNYDKGTSVFGKLTISNMDHEVFSKLMKSLLVAPKGCHILVADFSQIEMRILAALSNESDWIQIFIEECDIHEFVANKLFKYEYSRNELAEQQFREYAKVLSYGMVRGQSEQSISKELKISRSRIKYWMELYRHCFPKILQFLEETSEKGFQRGFSETLLGRRIPIPFKNSQNYMEISVAKNICRRGPIEGTQADIFSLAMIQILEKLRQYPKSPLILQDRDQLIFQVTKEDCEKVMKLVKSEVSDILPLPHGVPIRVRLGIGNNWSEATKDSMSYTINK